MSSKRQVWDIQGMLARCKQDFVINKEQARGVAHVSIDMLHKKIPPFDNPYLFPDTLVPKGIIPGSREHAFHVFYGCSIDSMRRATEVYKALRGIAQEVKIEELHKLSIDELTELVKKHLEEKNGFGNPAQTLYENSRVLAETYQNDPRMIGYGIKKQDGVEGVDRVMKELVRRVNGKKRFRQVGFGKAALIMKNFVRFEFWDLDEHELYIKPDRHVMRISLGAGVVKTSSEILRADKLVKPLARVYREITHEDQLSGIELDDATWGIGTESCGRNNKLYCMTNCRINCKTRPDSDNRTIWFFPGTEKRRNSHSLF